MTAKLTILSVAYPFAPVSEDPVGGAEQVLSQLDRAVTAAGHRSIVIAQQGSSVTGELRPVRAVEGEISDAVLAMVHRQVRDRIAEVTGENRPGLIHFHGFDFACYLPPPGPPCLVSLHLPLGWYDPAALKPQRPGTWLVPVSASQWRSAPYDVRLLEPIANGVPIPESMLRDLKQVPIRFAPAVLRR